MREYHAAARLGDRHGVEVRTRQIVIPIHGEPAEHPVASSPLELLLAAVAAQLVSSLDLAATELVFRVDCATARLRARLDGPASHAPTLDYDLELSTAESDARLAQLHEQLRRQLESQSLSRLLASVPDGCLRRAP